MSENYPGRYIVIEGADGAGTTTQRDLLISALQQQGITALSVAEPGGTPIGDALRAIIKDAKLLRMPASSLGMFTIARAELADQVMEPALKISSYVVSDRNWLSSYAYQGIGEGLDVALIVNKSREAMGDLFVPDVRILLDIPVEVAQQRMADRGGAAADYFESKGPAFFEKVRTGYLEAAHNYNYTIIDGTDSIQSIHDRIATLVGTIAINVELLRDE